MKIFVGITDNEWYSYLAAIKPNEVNFWRPSGKSFQAIDVGCPFLFKLHSPSNFIAGGGYFVKAETLPISLAWKVFEEKNGASDFEIFSRLIRSKRHDSEHDPIITCIILNEPFFFPRDDWILPPEDWKANIVTGKSYDTSDTTGSRLWTKVQQKLAAYTVTTRDDSVHEPQELYGKEYLMRSRIGQGAFRVLVTSAYHKRCSITGERTLLVLEAGHIKPFSLSGPNKVSNGILFRADMHILFDQGYLTITPEYKVEVSKSIKEEFENGRDYYAYHGKALQVLPDRADEVPSRDYLEWHNEKVYLG
jgi:putative restriction endonuclease